MDSKIHENVIKDIKKCLSEYSSRYPNLSFDETLSESFILSFKRLTCWYYICKELTLSEEFIRFFKNEVSWYYIAKHQELSDSFIKEFKNELQYYIETLPRKSSDNKTMHENVKRDIEFICDKFKIPYDKSLDESFIKRFKTDVDWVYSCRYFDLSEEFIEYFIDCVDWFNISIYQELSLDFTKKYHRWLYTHPNAPNKQSQNTIAETKPALDTVKVQSKPKIKISEAFANGFKEP